MSALSFEKTGRSHLRSIMENELMPKYRFHSVLDVTPEDIHKMGARAIGLDIDNTIAPDGTFKFLKGVEHWLDTMRKAGIPVIIISNGTVFRVGPIAKKIRSAVCLRCCKAEAQGALKSCRKARRADREARYARRSDFFRHQGGKPMRRNCRQNRPYACKESLSALLCVEGKARGAYNKRI